MSENTRKIAVVGGGTAGVVLAARLSEDPAFAVTLLEAGPDDSAYGPPVLDPSRAPDVWADVPQIQTTIMKTESGELPMFQGRLLGGTSAINGLATLRGLPEDYDHWASIGLEGWGWGDVADTFIAAEADSDFPASPIHGHDGPLTVRRWRREEMSRAQLAYYDGMVETGNPTVADINDPTQLPGIGRFPVTIDADANRLTTSLAYLTPQVRARDNLTIRTNVEVAGLAIEGGRATGVKFRSGEEIEADEVVVCAGALWSPMLLMRSGIGPAEQLARFGITAHADLPVGETMSDHIGPAIAYRHDGPRGGIAGPAQVLLCGASDGKNVDYHAFPIAPVQTDGPTEFLMAVFLMRSSGRGSVTFGDTVDSDPVVVAPPLPDDGVNRLRHAFERIAAWEKSAPARELGCEPVEPHDLLADDAVSKALARFTLSYAHMTSTCPMGTVLDADCRVLGIDRLRVCDASVMPTIPTGNTYLGCVMIAERVACKMMAARS